MEQNKLITIIGPTAIGKTSLSIDLATHYKTEVLSCDSRQFYKEMQIGTAVPSNEELSVVKHHFIQNRSIFEEYSVGAFERDAVELLNKLFKERDIMIMTGGSGLYVDAVIKGLDDFPDVDPEIRKDLKVILHNEGIKRLQLKLKELDPVSFGKIDIHNKQRLIRALEISIGSNKPYSHYLGLQTKKRSFDAIKIGLQADREVLYHRINRRVDLMMQQGLLEESRSLYQYRNLNALQTVGYKELFAYFDGLCSLEEAVNEIKKNTRRFAKRQGTWFRRDPEITWFDHKTNLDEILSFIDHRRKK